MKRFMLGTILTWFAVRLASSALATSTISIPVGTVPKFVAVNQVTNRVYVSNLLSNNVSVIDGSTNQVIATVPVGNSPEVLEVNSGINMIYVANVGSGTVSVVDGASNTVTATILLGSSSAPIGVAVDSTRNLIYAANSGLGTVSVIDGKTNTVTATVQEGSTPAGIRVDSASNLIYVANFGSGTVSVISGADFTVTNTFTLPSSADPLFIALEPIANRLYITDAGNEVVDVLDASSGALLKTINGGRVPFKSPVYVTMFQPGKSVLISDLSLGTVVQVSESSYAATAGLKGGNGPYGIAVNRKTGKIYVAESGNGTVNVYSGFGGALPATAHPHAQK